MGIQCNNTNSKNNLPDINIPQRLRQYHLRPDKSLGQNFLVETGALEKIIEIAELQPDEIVLEIGPGLGSLTRLLALKAAQVIAVELDNRLIPELQDVLSSFPNVDIIQGDILSISPAQLLEEKTPDSQLHYSVVANIPYHITSALIRHLLEARLPPQKIVLTIQKEVAERICVKSGKMSLLALSVKVYGEPKLAAIIPAHSFFPQPEVDSAVIRIDLYKEPILPNRLSKTFFRLARAGFSQKRKMLRNALSAGMHWESKHTQNILDTAGIESQRRAETLSVEEWLKLAAQVSEDQK